MPPVVLLVLPLEEAPLWMTVYFLGVIDVMEKLFEEGFVGKKGDLECRLKT